MKNRNLFLLIALATCWGPSFLFIKIAVAEVPPLMLTAIRIGLAAVLLNLYLLLRGERLMSSWSFWKRVLIAGFFAQGLPFALINWGQQYIDSSLASLLNGLTPLSTIILAHLMLKDEKMTKNKVTGVLLGLLGLIILVAPSLLSGVTATTVGILSITLAALSYGVGLVYIRKNLLEVPPIHAPAAQLLLVTIYMLPLALIVEPGFILSEISWQAIGSLAVLGSIGTALAFVIYYKLLERTGASYVSMVTYLMPVYGVILGVVFLDEQLTSWMVLGATSILMGVAVANGLKFSPKKESFKKGIDLAYFSKVR